MGSAVPGDAVGPALDAGDQPLKDLLDQLGVLAEGAEGALPAGIADAVGHVHIALAQAAGGPLAPDAAGKLVDQGGVAVLAQDGRRDAQGAGPGGEHTGGVVHAKDHLAVLVAGVGGRLHRNKVLALFGHGVQLVEPVGHVGGGGAGPQDQVAVEPLFDEGGGAGQVLLAKNGLAVGRPCRRGRGWPAGSGGG